MRYLDPKADLTFKHVFGEHPDLVISLLNALLPLTPRHEIREIEYLPAELVPESFTQEQYRGRPLPRCRRTSVYRRDANDLVSGVSPTGIVQCFEGLCTANRHRSGIRTVAAGIFAESGK